MSKWIVESCCGDFVVIEFHVKLRLDVKSIEVILLSSISLLHFRRLHVQRR